MNFFVLAPLVAAIINSFLGIFVFTRSPQSHINRLYLLFSCALVTWNIGVLLMFFANSPEQALTITRGLHFGVIFLPFFLIHIVLLLIQTPIPRYYLAAYLLPVFLSLSNTSDWFIRDIKESPYSYYGVAGPGFHVFSLFLIVILVIFFVAVIRKRKTAEDFEKSKINSLLWAYFILLFSGVHDTVPVFEIYHYPLLGTTIYPLGMIGSIIFAVLLAYGVLQHQILNIYTNLGRVAATCARLFLLFLGFFLSLLTVALIFPDKFSYFALFSSIVLFLIITSLGSVLFPKLLGIGEEYLEKKLLGDRFEYQDKIRGFSNQILYYSKDKALYDDLRNTLDHVFQFQKFYLFILDEKSESFYLAQSHPEIAAKESYSLPTNSSIPQYFDKPNEGFLSSFIGRDFIDLEVLDDEHRRSLHDLTPKHCFPLRSGSELLGLLMLGKKAGNRPVTNLDMQLIVELTTNLGLFINHSRLKRQVAQSQEIELLGNLSRGLAHDLNNLITPISTYCQLTDDFAERNESLKTFAAVAQRNLSTMQSYIREALFFSTNQEPKVREISVSGILNNLRALYETTLAARGIELRVSCLDDIVMTVDDVLIQRLLSNLIHNAADASPDNSPIDLRVADLKRRVSTKRWIRFTVRDYGSGIPEREIEKVFTPYFTTKDIGDNKRGSGLGLSICRRIVQLHQGDISITSTVNQGTQVTIDLPEEISASKTPSTPPVETTVGSSKT